MHYRGQTGWIASEAFGGVRASWCRKLFTL